MPVNEDLYSKLFTTGQRAQRLVVAWHRWQQRQLFSQSDPVLTSARRGGGESKDIGLRN
jgi:hypothetical protein